MAWTDNLPAVRGKLLLNEPLGPYTWFRVGGAAEALFISPPAVIQQINLLEGECGVRLFERSNHGVRLTPEAVEILFGAGSKLTKMKDLYQQGEFASEQLVTIIGPRAQSSPTVPVGSGVTPSSARISRSATGTGGPALVGRFR